jgi:hypothetical protein
MNLHNMKDLTRSLHEAFCQELNTAWLDGIKDNPSYQLDISKFETLRLMISDAKKMGYDFLLNYDSAAYMGTCAPNENEIDDEKASIDLKILNNMIGQCSSNGWECMRLKLTELKRKKLLTVMEDYAQKHAQKQGPFYTGKDLTNIHVYGLMSDVGYEMVLLTFIHGHIDKKINKLSD